MSKKSHHGDEPSSVASRAEAPYPTPEQQLRDGLEIIRQNVQEAPYASLGLALGAGIIVGGGMWRVLARSLIGTGARLAVALVVPALIESSGQNQRRRQREKEDEGERREHKHPHAS